VRKEKVVGLLRPRFCMRALLDDRLTFGEVRLYEHDSDAMVAPYVRRLRRVLTSLAALVIAAICGRELLPRGCPAGAAVGEGVLLPKPGQLPAATASISSPPQPESSAAAATPAPTLSALPAAAAAAAHCGRTWPIVGDAVWEGAVAWGFNATNCGAAYYSGPQPADAPAPTFASLERCLARRRVYVWGNSVTRGFAFELAPMLDNSARVSREEQKARCAKLPDPSGDRCDSAAGDSTTVLFSWIQWFDSAPFLPAPSTPPLPEYDGVLHKVNVLVDTCGIEAPRDCFGRLLKDATADDILILQVGYYYALMDPHTVPVREQRLWRQAHVRAFIALLKELFPGTVVYMNVAPALVTTASSSWSDVRTTTWNEMIMPLLLAETDWLVFDLWSVVSDFVGSPLFEDRIHFPGRLTQIGWGFLEQMLCHQPRAPG